MIDKDKFKELCNKIGDLYDETWDMDARNEKRKEKIALETKSLEKELNQLLEFDVFVGEYESSWKSDSKNRQWLIKKYRARYDIANGEVSNKFILLDKNSLTTKEFYKLEKFVRLTRDEVIEDIIQNAKEKEKLAKETRQFWAMELGRKVDEESL